MATLHRFKLLATQCATAAVRSPVTSPSASPCVAAAVSATTPSKSPSFNLRHHRRRRTLRRLLSGSYSSSGGGSNSSSSSSAAGGTRSIFTKAAKGRSSLDLGRAAAPAPEGGDGGEKRGLLVAHTSLKDLFVSSPSPPPSASASGSNARGGGAEAEGGEWLRIRSPVRGGRGGWRLGTVDGLSSRRFAASGGSLRSRLLRRAWRPVLVTIPE